MPALEAKFAVSQANVLSEIFSPQNVLRTIRRLRRDADNLVAHPLRRALLREYGEQLAEMVSRLVPSGRWSPSAAYTCLVRKRSGNLRELVFPGLIDALVGRCLIDALEPQITQDDGGRTFCGRMHANTNREPGDYERWFAVWQDYTSAIASAARDSGFAYVFDTDVSDFFPSVDRAKAKQFLAERTGAHSSILELLFYCLETWLPRFSYSPMSGIPIENNDISRLVAHNYLKVVDKIFLSDPSCQYLRYVDDTVIFAQTEGSAEDLKRRHHLALRQVGLNPNAAKSQITTVEEFEAERHREFNLRLEAGSVVEELFLPLVEEWYGRDRATTRNWDRVARRLYSTAQKQGFASLRGHVLEDLRLTPDLAFYALRYLERFELTQHELDGVLAFCRENIVGPEPEIYLARFLCEARFGFYASDTLADFAVWRILSDETRHGGGYAKGLWLLVLHKHGRHRHRKRVSEWASVDKLEDEQFRLHYLYVFFACDELSYELLDMLRHLSNPDIELTMRLAVAAKEGRMRHHGEILKQLKERGTIQARYLPLLRLMFKSEFHRDYNVEWLSKVLAATGRRALRDSAVRRFLEEAQQRLTA